MVLLPVLANCQKQVIRRMQFTFSLCYATFCRSTCRVAKHTRRGSPYNWRIPQSACKVVQREVDSFMRHHHGFVACSCKLLKGSGIPNAVHVYVVLCYVLSQYRQGCKTLRWCMQLTDSAISMQSDPNEG